MRLLHQSVDFEATKVQLCVDSGAGLCEQVDLDLQNVACLCEVVPISTCGRVSPQYLLCVRETNTQQKILCCSKIKPVLNQTAHLGSEGCFGKKIHVLQTRYVEFSKQTTIDEIPLLLLFSRRIYTENSSC